MLAAIVPGLHKELRDYRDDACVSYYLMKAAARRNRTVAGVLSLRGPLCAGEAFIVSDGSCGGLRRARDVGPRFGFVALRAPRLHPTYRGCAAKLCCWPAAKQGATEPA